MNRHYQTEPSKITLRFLSTAGGTLVVLCMVCVHHFPEHYLSFLLPSWRGVVTLCVCIWNLFQKWWFWHRHIGIEHFNVHRHSALPNKKITLLWLSNFRGTRSVLNNKPPGRPWSIQTHGNVQAVRQSYTQSPWCSAVKPAAALEISVRRILFAEFQFHLYKMMVIQQLH